MCACIFFTFWGLRAWVSSVTWYLMRLLNFIALCLLLFCHLYHCCNMFYLGPWLLCVFERSSDESYRCTKCVCHCPHEGNTKGLIQKRNCQVEACSDNLGSGECIDPARYSLSPSSRTSFWAQYLWLNQSWLPTVWRQISHNPSDDLICWGEYWSQSHDIASQEMWKQIPWFLANILMWFDTHNQ